MFQKKKSWERLERKKKNVHKKKVWVEKKKFGRQKNIVVKKVGQN